MKIELDFDQKIITVVSEVNMKELYDKMKELNLEPKEWKLQHNIVSWSNHPVYKTGFDGSPIPNQAPIYEDPFRVRCSPVPINFNGFRTDC